MKMWRCLRDYRSATIIAIFLTLTSQAHAAPRWVTATVYDSWYHGRQTACGSTYKHWGVSAAHPWLPCGTQVRVFHNGQSLVVPITDRCACNSIDLSAGAASRLRVPIDGIASVRISH
jgi:rare lipoprotein A